MVLSLGNMAADFVHLHTHTEFSLLDGLAKIPDLLAAAKSQGMDALAITDHGAMYGAIKFYLKAKELGIKPIIGVEAYQATRSRFDRQTNGDRDQHHLLLLAKNNIGYHNLLKLVTRANLEGYYYKPRIDMELLREHSEGLICLSGCLNGIVPHHLANGQSEQAEKIAREFLEIFGPDYYLELQKHPKIPKQDTVNEQLVALSRKLGIPLVATNDIHYIYADDAEAQEILLCVQTQHTMLESKRPMSMIDSPDFYLRSIEEMKQLFLQYPEAIENTIKIADQCNVEIQTGKWILPHYPLDAGETPNTYLQQLVEERLPFRYPLQSADIRTRIVYELDIIKTKGYATYFLIVQDFVNWAKSQGIAVGPGRGSAAGSIVSYILGITGVDPTYFNLPFERFLNPFRPSPPDIDLDFADDRRDEVIAYVTARYGKDKVAQISTFGTMEARGAVRDAGRALGMPYAQPDRIAKMIPPGFQGAAMTILKALEQSPDLSASYQNEPETKRLLDVARKLEGVARHASVHAAGVVISDKPLVEYTPLQKESKGDRIVTQYDMYTVGEDGVGLLKMDFLGLRNLTIISQALSFVRQVRGVQLDLATLPLDDAKTYALLASAETTGIFQLESAGMRRYIKDLKPTTIFDLMAMVALFRPGPMQVIPEFIKRKHNPQKIIYPHAKLKDVLKQSYGVIAYQDDVLLTAITLAGYSWGDADKLRKAVGKKIPAEMKKQKEKFINGCVENGISEKKAGEIFTLIEPFAGYGFNKAHAACYALIAYQTAYLKANYPAEYMTAVLTAESRGASGPIRDEKVALAVVECKRMGIDLLPPDINHSEVEFSIEKDPVADREAIRFGLSAIKNVGTAAIESILAAREKDGDFVSFTDFIYRVDLSKVNRKTIESLVKTGAFDRFGKRAVFLACYSEVVERVHKRKSRELEGQFSLFTMDGEGDTTDRFPDMDDLSREELVQFEKELLGFYLTHHPLTPYIDYIEKKVTHRLNALPEEKTTVIIGGLITGVKKILTKASNSEMAFVRVDDFTGSIELVVFPTAFERTRQIWVTDRPVLVKGKLSTKDDRLTIIVDDAKRLDSVA